MDQKHANWLVTLNHLALTLLLIWDHRSITNQRQHHLFDLTRHGVIKSLALLKKTLNSFIEGNEEELWREESMDQRRGLMIKASNFYALTVLKFASEREFGVRGSLQGRNSDNWNPQNTDPRKVKITSVYLSALPEVASVDFGL